MFYTGVNDFGWQVNNFSGTYPGNAAATTLTADGSAHTKGSDTACMNGIDEDCYLLSLLVSTGSTDTAIRRQMIDILIDPTAGVGNAGSSWSVLINNLYTNSPTFGNGMIGHAFVFPVFLKAGTAFGARTQDVVGGGQCRLSIRVYGKPTHPELLKVGTKVQTIGATAASTSGVTVVPGTAAIGSYSSSLGTLTNDAWWWQLGFGSADTTMSSNVYYFDVSAVVTNQLICAQGIVALQNTNETSSKTAFGERPPIRNIPAGSDVYVRAGALGTPDSSMSAVVYAVS